MWVHKILVTCFSMTLAAFGLVAASQYVHGPNSTQLVEAVDVVGNRRMSVEDVLSHIKTRPGDEYSEKQVQLDLQALLELNVFDKTETSVIVDAGKRGGVVVIFNLEELPLIANVRFEGLRGVDESEVLEALRENKINLAKDEVYDAFKIHVAVRVIRRYFASRGWPDISVTVRSEVGSRYASIEFLIGDEK
jgi:outer membrane protein assembly factor BamA